MIYRQKAILQVWGVNNSDNDGIFWYCNIQFCTENLNTALRCGFLGSVAIGNQRSYFYRMCT